MSEGEKRKIEEFINKAKDLLRCIENNEVVGNAVGYRTHALLDLKIKELEGDIKDKKWG